MKIKILALLFVAAMVFGFSKSAECDSGGTCETISVSCPDGFDGLGYGGWTGVVCNYDDYLFYMNYYCPEDPVGQ